MKKIYLSILSLMVAAGAMAQTAVTFNVNMGITGASDSLHVVGNFQDPNYDNMPENAGYENWNPGAPSGLMTDIDMDFIYTTTLMLQPGRYEFKFVNGNTWDSSESVPSACTVEVNGNGNRQIMVGTDSLSYLVCYGECADCGENAVRVRVDMSTYDDDGDGIGGEPGQDINPEGMFMNGSFVGWSTFVPLQDWDGNKIWEGLITTFDSSPIEFKFINGPDWIFPNETISGTCGAGNGNRLIPMLMEINNVLPVYCWNSCDPCSQPVAVTFSVDMNASCADTLPGINLMGTLTDWSNGAPMSDDDGDGIWTITLNLSAGNYEYKFRIGSGGWEGIGNRQLTVVADTPADLPVVCFNSLEPCGSVVPPADVTFEVRPGAVQLAAGDVMWVMGDFTQPNWQDGALQMTDADGDGTWSVTVPQVCIGSLFYKFRAGAPGGTAFTEESADFSAIGGCGVDNGTFSDNRQLVRTDGNSVTVCWTFDTCESCAGPASVSENNAVVSNLRVYPNPAEEILNVQFDAAVAARMTIRMVNSLGQVVVEENLGQVNGQKTLTMNTSGLASGVYALSLTNGSQVQLVNVMIK
jgi:Secretion system C-terminal sorting domain